MQGFEQHAAHWVLQNRIKIIVLSLLFLVAGINGAGKLHFTTDYRVFFSEDNPELLAFERMEKTFSKNDNVLYAIAPANGDIFTPENLEAIKTLTEKAWQIPYSNRVDSITNYQHTEAREDDLFVGDFVADPESLDAKQLQELKQIALNEPLVIHRLISKDADIAGINVTVQMPGIDKDKETPEIVEAARKLRDEIKQGYPDLEIYMTGMVMMNNAFSESSKQDMMYLVIPSFCIMLIILAFLTGSISGTLGTLVVILFSIIIGLGFGGYLGYPISPPSASAPTIILTVSIANCVHILTTLIHEMKMGLSKHEAIIESLRLNVQPVFIASITTALGFLGMNFSDVPPFRHLGNFVALGVIAAFFLSVTLLPVILSYLPMKIKPSKDQDESRMRKLGDFVVRNHSRLFYGMAFVILILVCALPRNQLNDIFLYYFDESVEFRTDSDFVSKNLTGMYTIEYMIDSGSSSGINNPDFMDEVSRFRDWLKQQPEVVHVNSITDVMKRLNRNLHGDEQSQYRLPDNQELSAQYLLLYEMSLPYGQDLNNQINVDKSQTLVFVRLETISSQQLIDFNQRSMDWLDKNSSHIKSTSGSGTSLMFANIGQRNIKSMLLGTTVALIFISLVLVIALRSIKIGLLSLVPNLAPAAMGFGLWGILVSEIGLSLSVVTTMTLGIVVDDTVHYLSKYLRARREKSLGPRDAVRYAFQTVGKALIVTSIVLAIGFFILSTSSFELNAGMGLLTGIVIIFALAADFLFLPPLLIKLEERKHALVSN